MRNRNLLTKLGVSLWVLTCFALLPQIQAAPAVAPPPDGCYPAFTTAEGCLALQNLTTGAGNTGVGWRSLFLVGGGNFNTGVGAGTLVLNTADSNTAVGTAALLLNTTGDQNTAVGTDALVHNDSGSNNAAVGAFALFNLINGAENVATGAQALFNLTNGFDNVATGNLPLFNLTNGSNNVAIGAGAGFGLTTGGGNVYIGAVQAAPVTSEDNHTYIRNINSTSVSGGGTDTVTVNLSTGLLGHLSSSRRHKEEIKPMEAASETLYRLKPVTYRYKKEIDRDQVLDYGLIAEEVSEIDPNLTICNKEGQIESVRYTAINNMLLNEFLKEHKKVEALQATVAQQQKGIEALIAQVQKVSAQIQVNKSAPRLTATND